MSEMIPQRFLYLAHQSSTMITDKHFLKLPSFLKNEAVPRLWYCHVLMLPSSCPNVLTHLFLLRLMHHIGASCTCTRPDVACCTVVFPATGIVLPEDASRFSPRCWDLDQAHEGDDVTANDVIYADLYNVTVATQAFDFPASEQAQNMSFLCFAGSQSSYVSIAHAGQMPVS